ncbi:Golgi transport complex subunit 4 [Kickxella alabastrina]|uniref:Golgi transport complex subunit 4 n=1 Tax=Kickxella alabastrina TaxID=61397 RepID=A0ACC1IFR8_9FUNG|nr:Golgi transport complex subunit 4 [Kickxella alabastrina]
MPGGADSNSLEPGSEVEVKSQVEAKLDHDHDNDNDNENDFNHESDHDHDLDLDLGPDFDMDLTDLAHIEHAYHLLELEETRIDAEIADAIEPAEAIDHSFSALATLQDPLQAVADSLAPVQAVIDTTAANAGAISARVRLLDRELASLTRALRLVDETTLLKQRLAELLTAMAAKDIDVAAALIHRYITTDAAALTSPFARFADPDPAGVIAAAKDDLVDRVVFIFDTAVDAGNTKDIARCFRLFPLLGDDLRGLDKYSDFLCVTLADKARISQADVPAANLYALRITRLFEIAAVIIDNNFPLVETHYGPGRMLRVIQRLHIETAKRAAMILDFFDDERHIERRLGQIAHANPRAKPDDRAQPVSDQDFNDITNILAEIVLVARQIATFNRFMESRAAPELRALSVAAEQPVGDRAEHSSTSTMHTAPIDQLSLIERFSLSAAQATRLAPVTMQKSSVVFDKSTGLVANTPLSARLEWLTDTYIAFESFFVSRSAAKAMSLDDIDSLPGWESPIADSTDAMSAPRLGKLAAGRPNYASSPGATSAKKTPWSRTAQSAAAASLAHISHTSSCVEDMFFVIKTALEHAVATQQPPAVETICQLAINVMNSVFLAAIEPRAMAKWNSTTLPGSLAASRVAASAVSAAAATGTTATPNINPQSASQRSILVSLNNLDLAILYLQKTTDSLRARVDAEWQRIPQKDHTERALKALDTVAAFSAKFTHAKQRSLEQLTAHLIKPWVRSILQQSYRDIKYVLTDEEFNDVQNDNLFQKRFTMKFTHLSHQLKHRLTTANYAAVLAMATTSLATDWERAIRQSKFNILGGIMFEKDVRELQRYLEHESAALLRQKFARLVQMADVLAVEDAAEAQHILDTLPATSTATTTMTSSSLTTAAAAGAASISKTAGAEANSPSAALSKSEAKALLANRIDISEKDVSALTT